MTEISRAFEGYGSKRGESAEIEELQKRMAAAREENYRLKKMLSIGEDGYREEQERIQDQETAEETEEEEEDVESVANSQEFKENGWDGFDEVIAKINKKKEEGNTEYALASTMDTPEEIRQQAQNASILYLDASDLLAAIPRSELSLDQSETCDLLKFSILLNRAAAYNKQEDWKLGLRAANEALTYLPRDQKGLFRRAVALAGLWRFDEAEGDLRRILQHNPKNRDAQKKLRQILIEKKQFKQAKLNNHAGRATPSLKEIISDKLSDYHTDKDDLKPC